MFDIPDNERKFQKICKSWLKTPYKHFSKAKGKGVDCFQLCIAIFQELYEDFPKNIDIPYYSKDFHIHRKDEMFLDTLEKQQDKLLPYKLYNTKVIQPMNFLLFRKSLHGIVNHSALSFTKEKIIHSHPKRGVEIIYLDDFNVNLACNFKVKK